MHKDTRLTSFERATVLQPLYSGPHVVGVYRASFGLNNALDYIDGLMWHQANCPLDIITIRPHEMRLKPSRVQLRITVLTISHKEVALEAVVALAHFNKEELRLGYIPNVVRHGRPILSLLDTIPTQVAVDEFIADTDEWRPITSRNAVTVRREAASS